MDQTSSSRRRKRELDQRCIWLGGLIDLIAQQSDDGYGLSWYGIGFGTALALITAAGSVYSHSILNLVHQEDTTAAHEDIAPTEDVEITFDEHSDEEEHHHGAPQLTWLQRTALAGDFISHTGDIAGPIVFIADIAAKERLPLWAKGLIHGGATLFGGFTSVANVRTCRNSMLKLNSQLEHEEHHHSTSYSG